jgi:hypothetical protein
MTQLITYNYNIYFMVQFSFLLLSYYILFVKFNQFLSYFAELVMENICSVITT